MRGAAESRSTGSRRPSPLDHEKIGIFQYLFEAGQEGGAVRPVMGLSLSFDHRAMDGAPAAAFLARLKEILENPYLLMV